MQILLKWMESLAVRISSVVDTAMMTAQRGISSIAIRGPPLLADERGSVDIGGTLMIGISMIFISFGFLFLSLTTDSTETLLAYQYSANATITDATFTGYTSILGITPMMILVGYLVAAVISGIMGIQVMKGASETTANPGALIVTGLSIVFIAIGLIVEPIALDGIASIVHGGGSGINAAFTGYESTIKMTPMLIHLGFLAASVFSGFFGLKKLGTGSYNPTKWSN